MTNSMPTFAAYKNNNFVGYVRAVSLPQARVRALNLYGRCEVLNVAGPDINTKHKPATYVDCSFTHGRAPYATPGFEDRREALIAAYKASQG